MKKIYALVIVAAIAGLVSCSKSPETEMKELITDMTKLTEATAEKVSNAQSGKEAGEALIAYAEGMKKYADRASELEKKYPKMGDVSDMKFKAEEEALAQAMGKYTSAITSSMMKFSGSKEFRDALGKISTLMKE